MDFWWIVYIIDIVLFALVTLTVAYVTFFSLASLINKQQETPKAKRQNRFIVLIPAYKSDANVLHTVNSILAQTYPQRLFDVVVISDHQKEMTNMRLAQCTVTLLIPDFEKSAKTKSLQYAMLNLPEFKIYDVAVVLNSDTIVEQEFLEQLNDAYEAAGTKAIVPHLMPRNRDTSSARVSSIFDEINNSIFRRGHITVGLSAALQGTGVAYEFQWFKSNIMKVRTPFEEKELEAALIHQRYYIDYFDHIFVYNERRREVRDFNRQRSQWVLEQVKSLIKNIRYLPSAIFNKQYDWVDKIIQWMLLPRSIMFAIVFVMSITLPFIYFTLVVKWWIIAIIWGFSLSFATPNALVDKHWDKDFFMLPIATVVYIVKGISAKIQQFTKKKEEN